jgi:serine/threonine protein kinase
MTPDRWRRVKDLFSQACDRTHEQRAAFLADACGGDEELRIEVSSLLESYRETGGVLDAPAAAAFAEARARVDPLVGREIGSYKIIRQIGRGGMGSVYLAERSDDQFRRRVAVKAMNPELVDAETLRRFHNERQTLAALDHPNIIKLLDGGTTEDGAPYLVMDYVEGLTIDEYCDSHKSSTTERLQLFRTVCAAVTYAHQNLVVHRDLKPSNILIAPDGSPKLLDFGIAKLLKAEYSNTIAVTRTDVRPMTPEYASPEQVLGHPITTASDIYSLGVLLYRLLTGVHPYRLKTQSALELERAICQTDPEKPSTSVLHAAEAGMAFEGRGEKLARRLKGDLDMIVLMAMRKEPQRRYPSAEHLSEDIRRHLEGLPVMAARDSWRYRTSKFVARNKAAVAATVAIAAALISSTLYARSQQEIAEKRFQDLRRFANFTVNDLDDAMRSEAITPVRQKLVRKAMEYLDGLAREARNDASIQRDLIRGYIKTGDIQGNLYQSNLGESGAAEQSYRKALAIAETLVRSDADDVERASVNLKLADMLMTANGKEALKEYGKTRQIYEELRAKHPSNPDYLKGLVRVWDRIGSTQQLRMGDDEGALRSYRQTLQLVQELSVNDPKGREKVAFARQRVAYIGARTGDTARAEDTIRESIRIYESSANPDSPREQRNIATAYENLADVQKWTGKLPEALESVRASLKRSESLLAKDRQNQQFQIDVHQALVREIDILARIGNAQEARVETEKALRFLKPLVEREDASIQQVEDYCELLETTPFKDLQNNAAAFRYARKALAMTHESDPKMWDLLARAYAGNSDFAKALEMEQKAIGLLPPANPSRDASELRRMLESNAARFRSGLQAGSDASQARR